MRWSRPMQAKQTQIPSEASSPSPLMDYAYKNTAEQAYLYPSGMQRRAYTTKASLVKSESNRPKPSNPDKLQVCMVLQAAYFPNCYLAVWLPPYNYCERGTDNVLCQKCL